MSIKHLSTHDTFFKQIRKSMNITYKPGYLCTGWSLALSVVLQITPDVCGLSVSECILNSTRRLWDQAGRGTNATNATNAANANAPNDNVCPRSPTCIKYGPIRPSEYLRRALELETNLREVLQLWILQSDWKCLLDTLHAKWAVTHGK